MVEHRRLSKTISHALRHAPWLYELELDEAGWTPVDGLLHGLRRHHRIWQQLDEDDLQAMIVHSDKRRFEIRDGRIRALYGHSVDARIQKELAAPPPFLYHGTAPQTVQIILQEGIRPMGRQYVHLSLTRQVATEVGKRKSRTPQILIVHATAAHRDGVTFYAGNDMVWLADAVPPEYVRRDEDQTIFFSNNSRNSGYD